MPRLSQISLSRLGRQLSRSCSHLPAHPARQPGGPALLQTLQRLSWSRAETESLLRQCGGDASKLAAEMTRLSRQGRVAPVLHLLQSMPAEAMQVSAEHVHLALQTCSVAKDSVSAFNLVMGLEETKVETSMYKTLLLICSECSDAESAASTLATMRARNIPIDISHWNCLLNALAERKDIDAVVQSIEEMSRDGVKANIGSYNILLKACSRAMNFDRAMLYFNQLDDLNLQPDRYTWSQIVQVATSTGHMDQARALIQTMLESKKNYQQLTPFVFNHVLKAQAAANDMSSIDELFKFMRSHSIRPDIVSYQYALTVAAKLEDKDKLTSLLQQLLVEGAKLNHACWKLMVAPFSRSLDVEGILGLMDTIRRNFQPVESFMWRDAIIVYGRLARLAEAEEVLLEMRRRDRLEPSAECFHSVIRAFTDHSEWRKGLSILRQMRQRGFTPSAELWMLVIAAHGGAWNDESVASLLELFREMIMVDKRLPSQPPLRQLFHSLTKNQGGEEKHVDPTLFVGFLGSVDPASSTTMTERNIDALLHSGRVLLCHSILQGREINESVYWNALLSAALQHRNLPVIESCLRHPGFKLEAKAARDLVHYYVDLGEVDAALTLVGNVLSADSMELSTELLNSFLLLFLKTGNRTRFQEIINLMHRSNIALDEASYRMWIQMTVNSSKDVHQGMRLIDAM